MAAPPSKTRSDPSSTAHTINKITKPDSGKIEFGDQYYQAALIREVNSLRANPKKYAKVLAAHVESNPSKFHVANIEFKTSLDEAIAALKKKGKDIEAGKLTLSPLNFNTERSAIAGQGMDLLASRGLELAATRDSGVEVDTSNSNFLDGFIDHDPIEHLRTAGSDNALSTLKEKAGGQVMLHATDLENLHASTADSVTVRDVIAGWLIDHDVSTRGHRNALLNAGITEIGVGASTASFTDKTGRDVTVKITGMNFYGIRDFSTGELLEKPPTR
jgi:hypothetical protein